MAMANAKPPSSGLRAARVGRRSQWELHMRLSHNNTQPRGGCAAAVVPGSATGLWAGWGLSSGRHNHHKLHSRVSPGTELALVKHLLDQRNRGAIVARAAVLLLCRLLHSRGCASLPHLMLVVLGWLRPSVARRGEAADWHPVSRALHQHGTRGSTARAAAAERRRLRACHCFPTRRLIASLITGPTCNAQCPH